MGEKEEGEEGEEGDGCCGGGGGGRGGKHFFVGGLVLGDGGVDICW